MELALGYQGSVGAFNTFATSFSIDLEELAVNALPHIPEDLFKESERMRKWAKERDMPDFGLSDRAWAVCDSFKSLWRQAHPAVVKLWSGLEETFRLAAASTDPDEYFHTPQGLPVQRVGTWVRMRLPSGRYMCYPDFQVDKKLSYTGVHQFTRKWTRIDTYGGKLAENATQAAARDVLCYGMQLAEAAGYSVVLHVHDELICEVPDSDEFNVAGLAECMAAVPVWATDLPLAAAGFETQRYKKG
jgi:DNA polymerase